MGVIDSTLASEHCSDVGQPLGTASLRGVESESEVKTTTLFVAVAFCIFAIPAAHAQAKRITPAAAKNHVGEQAMVCGKVASARYARDSKGEPTFLNLDQPYPKQVFTIVIWGDDRAKFGEPELKYRDQKICVTGKITGFRGEPEIVANNPDNWKYRSKPRDTELTSAFHTPEPLPEPSPSRLPTINPKQKSAAPTRNTIG